MAFLISDPSSTLGTDTGSLVDNISGPRAHKGSDMKKAM